MLQRAATVFLVIGLLIAAVFSHAGDGSVLFGLYMAWIPLAIGLGLLALKWVLAGRR